MAQKFCTQLHGLSNVTSPIVYHNALGWNLSKPIVVGISSDVPPYIISRDPVTNQPNGGYLYFLHNELATRGGFSIQYKTVSDISLYRSTDEWLQAILPTVDIFGGLPIPDTSRRRTYLTLDFTRQVADMSVVLISPAYIKSTFVLFAFLLPFGSNLWLYVVGSVMLYSLLLYVMEDFDLNVLRRPCRKAPTEGEGDDMGEHEPHVEHHSTSQPNEQPHAHVPHHFQKKHHDYFRIPSYLAVYAGFLNMVRFKASIEPRKTGSRIMKVGFSFFMLVVSTAYLANQANMLVAPAQVVLKVLTVESALKNQNTICAMAGKNPVWCQDCAPGMGTPYSVINATYPTMRLVAINSNDPNDALKGIQSGLCDAAAISQLDWDFTRNAKSGNPTCTFMQSPELIRTFSGGFPLVADYGSFGPYSSGGAIVNPRSRCASTIALVISALLSDIRGDGTMAALYARAQRNYWNQACIPLNKLPISQSLKLTDLAGVILVYVFTAAASFVLICVFAPWRERLRYGKSRSGSEPNSNPSNNDEGEMKETEEVSGVHTIASTLHRADSRSDYNPREIHEAQDRVMNERSKSGIGKNEGTLAMDGSRGDGVDNEKLERRLNVVKQQMGVVERQVGKTSKGGTWASLSSLSKGYSLPGARTRSPPTTATTTVANGQSNMRFNDSDDVMSVYSRSGTFFRDDV